MSPEDTANIETMTAAMDLIHETGGYTLCHFGTTQGMHKNDKISDYTALAGLCIASRHAMGIQLHFIASHPRRDIPDGTFAVMVPMTPDEYRAWRKDHEAKHPPPPPPPQPVAGHAS